MENAPQLYSSHNWAEKTVDSTRVNTPPSKLDEIYDIQKCVAWIKENNFLKVCLQFPDHLLPDSSDVALKLQQLLGQTVYILGDTAYGSCCIDYVAAAHINADSIIHYGPTCLSKSSDNIPHMNVYEKLHLNTAELKSALSKIYEDIIGDVCLVLDDGYVHFYDSILQEFADLERLLVKEVNQFTNLDNKSVIFITNNQRKLMNFALSMKINSLYYYDPPDIKPYESDQRIIKRRYFLMEKIRDASTIGIVIGTLGVKNYLEVIERLKRIIEKRGKKYYLISVGKPTVAKLANIGEVDVYAIITCSMNEIYDSRDFYKPIVTPYDVEMALNFMDLISNNIQFSYDYNSYLSHLGDIPNIENTSQESDVSLLTGKVRSFVPEPVKESLQNSTEIALKTEGTVALNSNYGAGYLSERSWKGLEQNLGQSEVKLAEEGKTGLAQGYDNEKILLGLNVE
ncbi:2-(3-amino-3-carboxypropyl)histidine synthase subunit 2 [Anthonomus grandis grandis]|uniref:2-(3-amino-3-carboxypropyl)histidine synthase subunit 2 n=1 Tax=Anthonomus grandis grandis TaxID=2921223 RepID=UPI002166640F|nr:2-(3-amino-3-carboxypropyl)histidine synthase subunit 2 [Anthonomus grandis grandis]